MARESSAFFERGPHGLRLTQTARELYERGKSYRCSLEPEQSPAEQIEEHAVLTLAGVGTPVPIQALVEYTTEHAAEIRAMIGGEPPPPLEQDLANLSDDELIALVRFNPSWLAVPLISARVALWQHQQRIPGKAHRAARQQAGRLLSRLIGLRDAPGRPPAADRSLGDAFSEHERRAVEVQRAWHALEQEHPLETIVELGRRLHEVLEGTPPRRLTESRVKAYLAGLGAVVSDRDGKRQVCISDSGWPAAVTFANLEAQLGVSKSTIKRSR